MDGLTNSRTDGLTDERFYRGWGEGTGTDVTFQVRVETTDLLIRAERDLSAATLAAVVATRTLLTDHIAAHPEFATALRPLDLPAGETDPLIASMYRAAQLAHVGPMAAVAGTVAQAVGVALLPHTRRVMVENGGDLFIDADREVTIAIYAGRSKLNGKIALRLGADELPLAVCTSSGLVGPSLSYGQAQAATVIADDAALADAVATALGNRVSSSEDIKPALEWAVSLEGVTGALAIVQDNLGIMGDVKLVRL